MIPPQYSINVAPILLMLVIVFGGTYFIVDKIYQQPTVVQECPQ